MTDLKALNSKAFENYSVPRRIKAIGVVDFLAILCCFLTSEKHLTDLSVRRRHGRFFSLVVLGCGVAGGVFRAN